VVVLVLQAGQGCDSKHSKSAYVMSGKHMYRCCIST
jgi:hypothetical protein